MCRLELGNCTQHLLTEIADRKFTRRAVAQSYRLAMASSEPTDWGQVNAAIIARWGERGLERVKALAWSGKCFRKRTVGPLIPWWRRPWG